MYLYAGCYQLIRSNVTQLPKTIMHGLYFKCKLNAKLSQTRLKPNQRQQERGFLLLCALHYVLNVHGSCFSIVFALEFASGPIPQPVARFLRCCRYIIIGISDIIVIA